MRSGRIGQFRAFDLKLQGAQGAQVKVTLPIVRLANNLLSVRDGKVSLDTEAAIQGHTRLYGIFTAYFSSTISN